MTAKVANLEKVLSSMIPGHGTGTGTARLRKSTPKNMIFFVGDGMGISSITAGRIFVGSKKREEERKRNQSKVSSFPEAGPLSFDDFPFTSLLKVRNM